ncbi:unnamed protein product [Cunninghamella echinulata]
MIPDEEERWDDLEIEDNSFMYRATRGIYSCYKDKEVALLCQRVLSPSYSDDDDTISTVTSHHSDKFSVDEHDYYLNDINSLMATPPSLSTKYHKSKTAVPITKNQLQLQHLYSPSSSITSTQSENDLFSELLKGYDGPGKITRLGQPYGGRVQMDYGDWVHDIEIPNNEPFQKKNLKQQSATILKNSKDNNNKYNKNDDDDDTLLFFNDDILDNDPFTNDLLLNDDDDNYDNNNNNNNNNILKQKRVHFGDDDDLNNNRKNNNTNSKINNLLNPFSNNQEQKSSLITTHQQWMSESDNEGFDDINLPDDMNILSFKNRFTNNKSKSTTCINNNNNIINNNSRKEKIHQLPIHLEKIQRYKENDHDDFIDGLGLIDEEAFKFRNINKKMKQQQQMESKLPKLKKNTQQSFPPSSSSASSLLSLPSTIPQNKRSVYENKLQRLTAPTYSSRQRTITSNNSFLSSLSSSSSSNNMNDNSNNSNHISSLKTRKSDINLRKESSPSSIINHHHHGSYRSLIKNDLSTSTPTPRSNLLQQQQQQKSKHTLTRKKPFLSGYDTKTTANGLSPTLMTRPKSSSYTNYGNGTELDDLDDLAVWKKSNLYSYNRTPTNLRKKQDPSKPWRQNMSKRNLKLIKPDGQVLTPEINGMKYDSKNKQWKGNEQAVKSFEATTKKRPALIKNMMSSKLSNKYSNAVSVGEMVFDQEEMKWNTINGNEVDIFAHINDLLDNTIHETSIIHSTSTFDRRRPSTTPMSSPFSSSSLPTSFIYKQPNINNNNNSNSNNIPNQHRIQITNYYNNTHHQHINVPIFYISDEMKTHMRDLEAEHKKQFSTWPIYEESETTKNQFGHIVPQYAYILY